MRGKQKVTLLLFTVLSVVAVTGLVLIREAWMRPVRRVQKFVESQIDLDRVRSDVTILIDELRTNGQPNDMTRKIPSVLVGPDKELTPRSIKIYPDHAYVEYGGGGFSFGIVLLRKDIPSTSELGVSFNAENEKLSDGIWFYGPF